MSFHGHIIFLISLFIHGNGNTINCIGHLSCQDQTLQCNANEECIVNCDSDGAQKACYSANIYANDAISMTVNCLNYLDCKDNYIHCGSGDCTLNCGDINGPTNQCSGVHLICGTGSCNIHCFSNSCTESTGILITVGSATSFQCTGDCSPSFPEPFSDTTSTQHPSQHPTQIPTKNPTQIPTKNPTQIPTKNPTQIPTKNPSRKPTRFPIKDPSNNIPTQYSPTQYSPTSQIAISTKYATTLELVIMISDEAFFYGFSTTLFLAVVAILIFFCICGVLVCLFIFAKMRKNRTKTENKKAAAISIRMSNTIEKKQNENNIFARDDFIDDDIIDDIVNIENSKNETLFDPIDEGVIEAILQTESNKTSIPNITNTAHVQLPPIIPQPPILLTPYADGESDSDIYLDGHNTTVSIEETATKR